MSNLKIITTVIFSFISLSVLAQNASVSGQISDSTSLIPNASVSIKNTKIGTTSNANGYFELKDLKAGNYVLVVSSIGFTTQSKNITLVAGQTLKLDLTLKSSDNNLNAVAVHGVSKNVELKQSGFNVNGIETKLYLNNTSNISQILNQSAGVKVREQGGMGSDFNFSLNGLSGKRVRFFLDGIPMEGFGKAMSINNIPVNLAERIEVYKGVVPVELGADALGGAVNIITNQNTKQFLDASYSYGSFNTSRAALSGRYSDVKTGLVFDVNAFHNYSDNDYLMRNNPKYDAAIKVNDNDQIIERDARRFHDAYRATMGQLNVSLVDKSWADKISLGLTYSNLYKEIQTGARQDVVYGALYNKENFLMPSLSYKKDDFILKGLKANANVSYSINKSSVVDTSSYAYDWGGRGNFRPILGELSSIKTFYHYKNKNAIARANFSYDLNKNNSLNLNYGLNHFSRSAKEDLGIDKGNSFDEPNIISKNIIGLAYQNKSFRDKLTTTIFSKLYNLNASVRNALYISQELGWVSEDAKSTENNVGYGIATRYKITDRFGIKASFEHAYRLQEADELFGNGIDVSSNKNLKPESSDNFNAGFYFSKSFDKNNFSIESSYFFRKAKDFIYFFTAGKFSSYTNALGVTVNGADAEFKYSYSDLLEVTLNATYQNAVNNQRYQLGTQIPDDTYGNRIPNEPWFYANSSFGIGKNNLLGKQTRLQFNYSNQFVNWFYLNWESRGSIESKNKIPSQFIHNLGLAYSVQNGKYNISVESLNVTNTIAYDNFRLQKPGRSFYIKLRYFIK